MTRKILALVATAALALAQECSYRVKDVEVTWEAYKTPLKTDVEGGFGTIKLSAKPDKSVDGLLEGAKVVIETASVDSKNAARDAKIVKYFFQAQGVDTITAEIKKVHDDLVDVEVTMNGVTRTVPMKLEHDGDKVEAEGVIDLADFDMLPSLASLNKACYKPHQGKTWQDVELSFELRIAEKCK
jgi:polyisoprenoid-binding protein YceI